MSAMLANQLDNKTFDDQMKVEKEQQAEAGTDRLRTVRIVVWRYEDGDEFKVVQLEPWEVLDYVPYEVLDFPEEGR